MTVAPLKAAMQRPLHVIGAHWYAPAFLAILGAVWWLARTPAFMRAGGEAALLIDLCVTAPVLYALCYARRQPLRTTLIRGLAIACGGLWLASWLIPADAQLVLPQLAPLRWIGITLLVLIELRLVVAAVRIAFSGRGSADQVRDASGAPLWIANLMLLEARMWKALWRLVRGRGRG